MANVFLSLNLKLYLKLIGGYLVSLELKMSFPWNGNLTSSMNYHVMRATRHILARLSIPCLRDSFLGLMLILNLINNLSPLLNFILRIIPPTPLIEIRSKF